MLKLLEYWNNIAKNNDNLSESRHSAAELQAENPLPPCLMKHSAPEGICPARLLYLARRFHT